MNVAKPHTLDLQLLYVPAYANFLLSSIMEEYLGALIHNSFELDIPLLRYFTHLPEDEFYRLSLDSNTTFLSALKNNQAEEFVNESTRNWIANQLPVVTRDQVIVDDITLINLARKRTLIQFIPRYTQDINTVIEIAHELDRFFTAYDALAFKIYFNLQQEQLISTNNKLQTREQQLLEAQEIGKLGSFEWDLTGNNRSVFTPQLLSIFELEETSKFEEFLKDVHPDDRQKLQTALEKALHEGIVECEYRYNRNNIPKIISCRGKVIFEDGKPARMLGTVTDVTEKAQLIARLKESEELSRQAQALTKTGNWKWEVENNRIEWSDEMYKIYGLEPQAEIITFERFASFIHRDDAERRLEQIRQSLQTGIATDYLMRIVTEQGDEKILKGKGEVLRDKNNKVTGMMGTCQDVTFEHNLTKELQHKNEELLRKNRDLQSYNFIASHDLQEPLRKIQLYTQRIKDEGMDLLPIHLANHFDKISKSSKRLQTMIEDFLTFYQSLNEREDTEMVDVNEIVMEIQNEFKGTILRKEATIIVDHLPLVNGIRPRIKQMLKQIFSNALKFSKTTERPIIRVTACEELQEENRFIKISIEDNGIGFDQQYGSKIFELFQKLHSKDDYSGSGIGLSLCKKIAEDHQGCITVSSVDGKGSVFNVYLPSIQ